MSNDGILKMKVLNRKAITSLILGILSIALFFGVGIILGVIGLILGLVALKETKLNEQKGKNIAISGVICSSLGIIVPILLMAMIYVNR